MGGVRERAEDGIDLRYTPEYQGSNMEYQAPGMGYDTIDGPRPYRGRQVSRVKSMEGMDRSTDSGRFSTLHRYDYFVIPGI